MEVVDYPNLLYCDGRTLDKEKYKALYESIKENIMTHSKDISVEQEENILGDSN